MSSTVSTANWPSKTVSRDYLTVADVLGMHAVLMQCYGGAPGVRAPGALEAALNRIQAIVRWLREIQGER